MTIFLALQLLYDACLLVTIAIGCRFGARSERCGVLILACGTAATILVMQPGLFDWRFHREALIVVDGVALLAFFALALRSTRFSPIWATAFHLITVCSHGAILILPPSLLQTYVVFQGFWVYPIMACIIGAAWSRRTRQRQHRTMSTP